MHQRTAHTVKKQRHTVKSVKLLVWLHKHLCFKSEQTQRPPSANFTAAAQEVQLRWGGRLLKEWALTNTKHVLYADNLLCKVVLEETCAAWITFSDNIFAVQYVWPALLHRSDWEEVGWMVIRAGWGIISVLPGIGQLRNYWKTNFGALPWL